MRTKGKISVLMIFIHAEEKWESSALERGGGRDTIASITTFIIFIIIITVIIIIIIISIIIIIITR
jgi:hypothetical protein